MNIQVPDICGDSAVSAKYILELKNSTGAIVTRAAAEYQQSGLIEKAVALNNCDSYAVNVTVFVPSHSELGRYTAITPLNVNSTCLPSAGNVTDRDNTSSNNITPSSTSVQSTIQTCQYRAQNDGMNDFKYRCMMCSYLFINIFQILEQM